MRLDIPFAAQFPIVLDPAVRDDVIQFFQSYAGKELLRTLSSMRPVGDKSPEAVIVARALGKVEGYEQVFLNLHSLLVPPQEIKTGPVMYPPLDDESKWGTTPSSTQ